MGFWQGLVQSYDAQYEAMQEKYPLSTTTISNNAEDIFVIVINEDAEFVHAYKIEKRSKNSNIVFVTIPVTEESLSRTNGTCPHPVFDKFEYIKGVGEKYKEYVEQLDRFANSRFAIPAIQILLKYIKRASSYLDFKNVGLEVKDNTIVLYEIEIKGKPTIKLWECKELFKAWHDYYCSLKKDKNIDYLSGVEQFVATNHPKKLTNSSGNAKLISNNDSSNYTYRGRFFKPEEALIIGYESSQKAHQFLRYLIQDRGIICDTQTIVAYKLFSREKVFNPINSSKDIYDELLEIKPSLHEQISAESGKDYAKALKLALAGFFNKNNNDILQNANCVVVIAFDAATTGRLSITYYRELYKDEYLEKIADWHSTCKWHLNYWNENKTLVQYQGTPSVDRIIEAVYGKARIGNDESYNKIKKTARERLLHCIFDGENLPKDYIASAIRRASNRVSFTSSSEFTTVLSTTCSMVRKFYKQQFEEDYKLALELNRTDRDYLYGRLLGAADKLEEYINFKESNDRITNALRYMNAFSQHPFKTWSVIKNCLIPYEQKLRGNRNFARDEIQKIMNMFEVGAYENDSPLNGTYLLGYYLERAEIERQVSEYINKKQDE